MSLYGQYFRTKEIGKALQSDEYRDENLDSYTMRVVNLLNDDRDLDALNGLRDIIKVLDLNNITRLKNSYDALSVAVDISEIIFNNIDWNQQMEETKNGESSEGNSETNFNNDDFNDPPESKESKSDSDGNSDENQKSGEGQSDEKSDENSDQSGASDDNESSDDNSENDSNGSGDSDENAEGNSAESSENEGDESDEESKKNSLSKTMKKRV